jgi:hypothetical protein
MLYIILRGHWFHIIVLNVNAPTEDKIDDVEDSFYSELEHDFNKFPKYKKKILLRGFTAEVGMKTFLNRQLGMKVYTKVVMIIELE